MIKKREREREREEEMGVQLMWIKCNYTSPLWKRENHDRTQLLRSTKKDKKGQCVNECMHMVEHLWFTKIPKHREFSKWGC